MHFRYETPYFSFVGDGHFCHWSKIHPTGGQRLPKHTITTGTAEVVQAYSPLTV
jgi:hypothetical protein